MKKFILILSLFMLFKPIIPVLEYIVFYDYIKNELCENRAKPELNCNGKCHLVKEMAKASNSPENGNDKKHFSIETSIVFCQDILENYFSQTYYYSNKSKIASHYASSYFLLATHTIFRPPVA